MKTVAPLVLIGLGLVGLIVMGIVTGGIPELQVEQLLAGDWSDRELKVHGIIATIESEERPLRFTIHDKEDEGRTIAVVADVSRPDTFQTDYDVAVQGRYDPESGCFTADQVFTKCPSKYEAAEAAGMGSPEGASSYGEPASRATAEEAAGSAPAPDR